MVCRRGLGCAQGGLEAGQVGVKIGGCVTGLSPATSTIPTRACSVKSVAPERLVPIEPRFVLVT